MSDFQKEYPKKKTKLISFVLVFLMTLPHIIRSFTHAREVISELLTSMITMN